MEGHFCQKLLQEIGTLLGFHKANATAYHLKTVELNAKNWDGKLPYVYSSTVQESTSTSPFRLLYCMAPNFHGRKFSYKTLNLKKLNFRYEIFVN